MYAPLTRHPSFSAARARCSLAAACWAGATPLSPPATAVCDLTALAACGLDRQADAAVLEKEPGLSAYLLKHRLRPSEGRAAPAQGIPLNTLMFSCRDLT